MGALYTHRHMVGCSIEWKSRCGTMSSWYMVCIYVVIEVLGLWHQDLSGNRCRNRLFWRWSKLTFQVNTHCQNWGKMRTFGCASQKALKLAFLDRFWWNWYLCPLIWGHWVQIWWDMYAKLLPWYKICAPNMVILAVLDLFMLQISWWRVWKFSNFSSDLDSVTSN